MSKYRKKPVIIKAITFEEFVDYGRKNGGNIVNGMPWSFEYNGHPVTHENDECYLIPTLEGIMRFTPQDMLITGVKGEIYSCKIDIFEATYEKAEENEWYNCFDIYDRFIGKSQVEPKKGEEHYFGDVLHVCIGLNKIQNGYNFREVEADGGNG